MFRKILIATDFSKPSKAALYAGLELAKKCLAEVLVVHSVTPLENYAPAPFLLEATQWRSDVEKQLEDFFPKSLYPNSRREILVGPSASEEILKAARTNHSDLIVIGTHGFGFIGRNLLGSVAQRVTRESETPVMVVRDVEHVHRKIQGFERVLVPTDFTDASLNALQVGVRFANFLKADLHLIHVVDLPAMSLLSTMYPGIPSTKLLESQPDPEVVQRRLNELLSHKELIGTPETKVLTGDPLSEILRYAKEKNINFIVMGTHGRRGLDRILLGSTTSGVVAKSDIPIITVSHPFEGGI